MSKDIYFFDKGRLPSCEGVKEECSRYQKPCQRHCDSNYGAHTCKQCESVSNPFSRVRCMSALEKCKAKEELHLYECHKQESLCEDKNVQILDRCEIKNLEKVSLCEEEKEKLLFRDDHLMLTELQIDFGVLNSYIVQRIEKIRFDEHLKSMQVKRNIHVSVDSRLAAELGANSHRDFNCTLVMDEALLTHSEYNRANNKRELPLLFERNEKGILLLQGVGDTEFHSLTLDNAPFDRLLGREDFSVQCLYQGMNIPAIAADKLLKAADIPPALRAVFSEVEFQAEAENFRFPISAISIGKEILLYPTMEEHTVGFSRQAHFY